MGYNQNKNGRRNAKCKMCTQHQLNMVTKEMVKYRLENTEEKLSLAKLLLEAGYYKNPIGRSYHVIFTAVLARDKIDFLLLLNRMQKNSSKK